MPLGLQRTAGGGGSRRGPDQAGQTLLEVLFAIFLIGVAFAAILGGTLTAGTAAKINRDKTIASAALQNYSEYLSQPVSPTTYKPCVVPEGHPAASSFGSYPPSPGVPIAPTGWRVRVVAVKYLRNTDPIPTDANTRKARFSTNWNFADTNPANINECADLPSMLVTTGLKRDNGVQQLLVYVEKQDAGGWLVVEKGVVVKRDQRCPTGGFQNLDQGPC